MLNAILVHTGRSAAGIHVIEAISQPDIANIFHSLVRYISSSGFEKDSEETFLSKMRNEK
jgi:hypothetical protein